MVPEYDAVIDVLRSVSERLRGYFDGEQINPSRLCREAYDTLTPLGLGIAYDPIGEMIAGDRWLALVHRLVSYTYATHSPDGWRGLDFRVVVEEAAETVESLASVLAYWQEVVPS